MQISKPQMFLIVGACFAVWLMWPKKTEEVSHATPSSPKAMAKREIVVMEDSGRITPQELKQRERRMAKAGAMMVAKHTLGLQTFQVEPKGNVDLKVKLSPLPQACMKGDVDVMEASVNEAKAKLLLTLEPLTSSSKASTFTISPEQLRRGGEFSFSVPYEQLEEGMGFFMCRDSTGSGRCRQKKVYDVKSLTNAYFNPKAGFKIAKDPIFFFQMLIADEGRVEIPASNSFSNAKRKNLARYLASKGPEQKKDSKKMAAFTHQLHARLSSVPIRVQGKNLTIVLPFQQGQCLSP